VPRLKARVLDLIQIRNVVIITVKVKVSSDKH